MTPWFTGILRCPDCGGPLERCGYSGRDLRAKAPTPVTITHSRVAPDVSLSGIDTTPPAKTYSGPAASRDSTELLSEISLRLSGGDALDLGCGPRDQAAPLAHLGFRYVGVDFSNPAADLLADAHALPFADDSFDCVLSYAVLEHLHTPHLALREVHRILKPGGWFVGTVSQGEPFHASYFHHTAWAVSSLVASQPGLRLERLWAGPDTLQSLASMGRYPRAVKLVLSAAHWANTRLPWLAPRRMRLPAAEARIDRLHRAGSICFSVFKTPK